MAENCTDRLDTCCWPAALKNCIFFRTEKAISPRRMLLRLRRAITQQHPLHALDSGRGNANAKVRCLDAAEFQLGERLPHRAALLKRPP